MTILIYSILALATFHFVYDGIVAPSIRLHLRNRLFALRDELRAIHAAGVSREDHNAFWYVHEGINGLLNRLPGLTMSNRAAVRRAYETDAALRTIVKAREEMLDNCRDARIKKVFERSSAVVEMAFLANAGGWAVYVVPVAFCALTIGSLRKLASEIVLTPQSDANRLIPKAA